jgi:hypothetical protein
MEQLDFFFKFIQPGSWTLLGWLVLSSLCWSGRMNIMYALLGGMLDVEWVMQN